MRSALRLVPFVYCALLLMVSPAFSTNSGGGECEACYNYCDPATGLSWAYCAAPEDGGWGSSNCTIDCVKFGSGMGACGCTTSGAGCMYIVVQG
jgi:hypothetical protein